MFSRSAFSLIELLVVIATIALLVGITLPALASAREAGRRSVCLSNMRQMSVAQINYSLTFENALIPSVGFSHSGPNTFPEQGSWFFLLQDYADGDLIFRCPSDDSSHFTEPITLGSGANAVDRLRRVSYATNYTLGYAVNHQQFNSLDKIPAPSNTIYAVELVEENVSNNNFPVSDHVHPESWLSASALESTIRGQVEVEQHSGTSNYSFIDGHAEAIHWRDTYEITGGFIISWPKNLYWPDVAKR